MARGRKFKRGGAVKSQAKATDSKPSEKLVETQIEGETSAAKEVVKAPTSVKSEPASAQNPESGKVADVNGPLKKGNRKRPRSRKGKKQDETEDVQEEKKIVDVSGMIFMCNAETKKDCFKYHVFGLPGKKKHLVDLIKKGMRLFLFDIDKRVLHGVYKARSEGGINLIKEAFQDSNRQFPAQVLFRIHKDCMPLDESAFKLAIKENYFGDNKFKCELNAEQVARLVKLFRPLDSKGLPQPRPGKDSKRDLLPKGKATRAPPHTQQSQARPRFSAPAPPREWVYKDYPPVYMRERHLPEMDLRMQPSYSLVPDVTEAEIVRQRYLRQVEATQLEAIDRRAYLPDPVEASLLRRRYFEDMYAAEQQGMAAKRPLLDTLYRGVEYQREVPYRSYGDGLHSLAGAVPYDPRASQLTWL